MEEQVYLTILYNYYQKLLTDKQQIYFEEYYFNNLSLAEISDKYNVSRNAIHKQLKEVEIKLREYEKKLNLYDNYLKIKELIKNLDENLQERIERLI